MECDSTSNNVSPTKIHNLTKFNFNDRLYNAGKYSFCYYGRWPMARENYTYTKHTTRSPWQHPAFGLTLIQSAKMSVFFMAVSQKSGIPVTGDDDASSSSPSFLSVGVTSIYAQSSSVCSQPQDYSTNKPFPPL